MTNNMRRILLAFIAVSLLGLTGLYTMRAAPEDNQVAAILRKFTKPQTNLPDQPDEWHGRINYAQLDQQFAAMAQRSEMAGLAIAIVEDDELRFVRTYGVIDRDTNVPVTLGTVLDGLRCQRPLRGHWQQLLPMRDWLIWTGRSRAITQRCVCPKAPNLG